MTKTFTGLIAAIAALAGLLAIAPAANALSASRAYEMVSPPDKNGADIAPDSQRTRAASDGSAVSFSSLLAFGDAVGTGIATDYLSVRSTNAQPGTSGWATHSIFPTQADGGSFETFNAQFDPLYVKEFSPDFNRGILFTRAPQTDDPYVEGAVNLYRRTDARTPGQGSYGLVTGCPRCETTGTALPPLPSTAGPAQPFRPVIAGATPDLGKVLFESAQPLTDDAAGTTNPKVFESDNGTVRLAGRIPAAPDTHCDDSATGPANPCVPADMTIAGTGAGSTRLPANTPHTISDGSDGHTRIFFTQPTIGNLYMRDGTSTAQLNASESDSPDTYTSATYWDAAADGSRVFFSTGEQLTDGAPDGVGLLYMYDATKPASAPDNLTLISGNVSIQGVVGVGGNGHYVYYLAGDQLFAWHDGNTSLIGAMPALPENLTSDVNLVLNPRQARVTPDGKHLLFSSISGGGLGGYDHGNCATTYGVGCRELYVYSADTDALACVSCNPSGARATVDARTVVREATGASQTAFHETKAISDDGSRVFFSTAEALVSGDINGKSDAYEYDVEAGLVHLLSSGKHQADSWFLDASADGRDAFFITRERLVGWDIDGAYDVYDARVGGGFPEPVAAEDTGCAGDSCQGSSGSQPLALAPASTVFHGAGNGAQRTVRKVGQAKRCRAGFVRKRVRVGTRKTRCVKKKRRLSAKQRTRRANDKMTRKGL